MKEAEASTLRRETERVNKHSPSREVVILGSDAVVCRTLELLLQGDEYDVRFVPDTSLIGSEALEDAGLLILTPELDARWRRELLSSVASMPATSRVPVLELIVYSRHEISDPGHLTVSWPCPTRDLKTQIESVRLKNDYDDTVQYASG